MTRTLAITGLDKGMRSDDLSVGTLREAVDVLPWRGALRRRGPITTHSATDLTSGGGNVPFILALTNGRAAGTAAMISNGAVMGLAGTTWTPMANAFGASSTLRHMAQVGREILICPSSTSSTGNITRWSGSVKADYSPAISATFTAGSKLVTFASALNTSLIEAGMYLYSGSAGGSYLVESVSTTTATLVEAARITATTTAYTFKNADALYVSDSTPNYGMFNQANAGAIGASSKYNTARGETCCFHQGRLFVASMREYSYAAAGTIVSDQSARIRWSALPAESDANGYAGSQYFHNNAYLDLPSAGGRIVAIYSYQGSLVAIRERSVDVISGGFSTTGADLGASVNTVAREVGALRCYATSAFEDGIVFASKNGCYVWDGQQVNNVTRGVIDRAWRKLFATSADEFLMRISTVGNRIVVHYDNGASLGKWFVCDFNTRSWFRMVTDASYGPIAEVGDAYIAFKRAPVAATNYRTFNFFGVFENLDSASADRTTDASGGLYPAPYVLTNPIPLGQTGVFDQARASELILNDGGLMDAGVTYQARLLRGAIYSGDAYSGESNLAAMSLGGTVTVPKITGSTVDQRSVKVRLDGSDDATHAMIEVSVAPTATTDAYAFALNAIGLNVEDNPNYPSA